MRVRIIRKPPRLSEIDTDSFMVGRVYNLAFAFASALMLDGYAELYETLTPEEKRERTDEASHLGWTANDHPPRWTTPHRKAEK